MRKVLYFITACAILGLFFSFLFTLLPVFTLTGKSFLVSVREGRYPAAYSFLSTDYHKKHSLNEFTNLMQEHNLNHYQEVEWTHNVMNKEKTLGYLVGIVRTDNSKPVPVQFNFVYTKGQTIFGDTWKIEDVLFEAPPTPG